VLLCLIVLFVEQNKLMIDDEIEPLNVFAGQYRCQSTSIKKLPIS